MPRSPRRTLVQKSVEAADRRVNRMEVSPGRVVVGRHASRDGKGLRYGGECEIVQQGLREFEGSQLALRRRGFDAAIALTVEMRTGRRRRIRHAVMRVVAGFARRVDRRQFARAKSTRPSHGNGEGGRDDWLPIAHRGGRIRLLRVAVKLSSGRVRGGRHHVRRDGLANMIS